MEIAWITLRALLTRRANLVGSHDEMPTPTEASATAKVGAGVVLLRPEAGEGRVVDSNSGPALPPGMHRWIIVLVALLSGGLLLGPRAADARITKLVVTTVQSPTFGGTTFGIVGAYEKIAGRAFGEIDPNDPRNATIADLAFAPRNPAGMVEYAMDVYLLKPVDMTRGSRKLFYEANNRGLKLATGVINTVDRLVITNDPASPADAGDGFLMRRGYVIAWSGWDVTVAPGPAALSITVPIATQPDRSPIVGPSLEEMVVDGPLATARLSYPAANLDTGAASLTVRTHAEDPPVAIASQDWEYVDARTVRLLPPGAQFQQGRLYDLVYPAQEPLVAGLAFAATRDFLTFLRRATVDDVGTANPVAGGVDYVYGFGLSQPARFLRELVHLGFNEDDAGSAVFDGLLTFLAGPGGGSFNHRFAQPGRTIRQHRDRLYPEIRFPFTWAVMSDPITGRTDGRLNRCLASGTCPRIFDVNSANEYWNKSASLLHTDASDRDLADPPNVRFYLLSSLPHLSIGGKGICQQEQNALPPNPALRGLLVALDEWVAGGKRPPASRVPRSGKGTLQPSLPQAMVEASPTFPASGTMVSCARAICSTSGRRRTRACSPCCRRSRWVRRTGCSCRRPTATATTSPASVCRPWPRRLRPTPGGGCALPPSPATTCATCPGRRSRLRAPRPSVWPHSIHAVPSPSATPRTSAT